MKETPVMSDEEKRQYLETRLTGENLSAESITGYELHNGVLPEDLKNLIYQRTGFVAQELIQKNGREPMFFDPNGVVYIPQFSGFGRAYRYERNIQTYLELRDEELSFEVHYLHESPRETSLAYNNYAYDLLKPLFITGLMQEVDSVILGPPRAVAEYAEKTEKGSELEGLIFEELQKLVARGTKEDYERFMGTFERFCTISEHIETQLVRIEEKKVLNIGYVYADQAGILVDKLLLEYDAMHKRSGEPFSLHLYTFGRAGGLHPNMQIHDLVYPTGVVQSSHVREGTVSVNPVRNILGAETTFSGNNLNVISVIDETKEQLARSNTDSVDMELYEILASVHRGEQRYRAQIDLGVVFHVSDLPLGGKTLAEELPSRKGERDAAGVICNSILRRK